MLLHSKQLIGLATIAHAAEQRCLCAVRADSNVTQQYKVWNGVFCAVHTEDV
jgi:hypothetical protein